MINIRREVSLLPYNTFGIPATAGLFAEVDHPKELTDFLASLSDPSSALILGGGSNVLFVSDRCETVIHPVFKGIEPVNATDGKVSVRVGAGEVWDDFVDWCVRQNYAGAESLSHIPGTVGACPIQNIGAYGVEAKEIIEKVETIEIATGKTVVFDNTQCQFGYRDSFFKKNKGAYLITAVQFGLSENFIPDIKYSELKTELSRETIVTVAAVRRAIIAIRDRKLPDPAEFGNAGSFFKNPVISAEKSVEISRLDSQAPLYPVAPGQYKISAAWLIQQSGMKDVREGRVGTFPKQPLVIVNYGGASGKEVLDFAKRIVETVDEKFGIRLEPEVNIV